MSSIGFIHPDRLKLIPAKYRPHHEFCFVIHDRMVALLKEGAAAGITNQKFDLVSEAEIEIFQKDPILFLNETGRDQEAKKILLNVCVVHLFSDFLNFIFEALMNLEKRKFIVSMALLRKPLAENLFLLSWLRGNKDEFYKILEMEPSKFKDKSKTDRAERLKILQMSISSINKLESFNLITADRLYDIIFRKNYYTGFGSLFDKALHLTTNFEHIRTESMNLNFIFHNPNDDDLYLNSYPNLSYILIYSHLLMISLYSEMEALQKGYMEYSYITSLGAYLALFAKGKNPLANELNKHFKDFLRCPYCLSPVSITKKNSSKFFIAERIDCNKCGLEHNFPLHWLFGHMNTNFFKEK